MALLPTAFWMTVGLCAGRWWVDEKWAHAKVKWRIFGLVVMWVWGAWVLHANPGWKLFDMWREGGEEEPGERESITTFIAFQLAWYGHMTFESLLLDWGRRDDFALLMGHHVVALWLVYACVAYTDISLRMHRMAAYIPVLDVSEILVLSYKLAKRSQWAITPHVYLLTLIMWFAIRVCLACAMLLTAVLTMPPTRTQFETLSVSFVCLLYCMNVFWFIEMVGKYPATVGATTPPSKRGLIRTFTESILGA